MTFTGVLNLYKTPLDSEYRNVYDDYTNYSQYVSFLLNFPHVNIALETDRIYSRKNVGDLFEFIVSGFDSMFLHDFNYMHFTDEDGDDKFAFILSVDSMNDNQANSSCLLHCKLDAWSNHYLQLKNRNINVNEKQCTYDNFLHKNYDVSMRKSYSKSSIIRSTLLDSTKDTANDVIYIPFWQVVKYGESQLMQATIDGVTRVGTADRGISFEDMATVYNLSFVAEIPIEGNTGIRLCTLDKEITINIEPIQWGTPQLRTYTFNSLLPVAYMQFKSEQILHHFVTPNVPFNYTITKNGTKLSIEIMGYASIADKIIPFGSAEESLNIEGLGYYVFSTNSNNKIKTTTFAPFLSSSLYNSNLRYADFSPEYSPLYYEFPFSYKSIRYNDNEIVVHGIENSSLPLTLRYEQNNSSFPSIHFIGYSDSVACYLIGKQDDLPILGVPSEKFIARNQASVFSNALTPLLSANIAPAIKEITNLMDLKNYPNKYNSVPFACQSLLQSSIPLIVDNIDTNIDQHIIDIHKNGAVVNMQMNACSKRKDCFDIDKGDIESNFYADEDSKLQIINAYKNGICRWHINSVAVGNRLNILVQMNKNCANFNVSEIT